MREMMCSMCGLGAVKAAVVAGQAAGTAAAAFEDKTAVDDELEDADDDNELPLALPLPPLPLPASASSLGHRVSPQSMRSSATRSALQGGRCCRCRRWGVNGGRRGEEREEARGHDEREAERLFFVDQAKGSSQRQGDFPTAAIMCCPTLSFPLVQEKNLPGGRRRRNQTPCPGAGPPGSRRR